MNKKRTTIYTNKLNLIGVISTTILIVLLIFIFKVNVLSIKYLLLIVSLLLITNVLGIILINLQIKTAKIIGTVILIIFSIVSTLGNYYLYYTNIFLNESFNNVKKTRSTYYIVTSKGNKYNKKEDITGNVYYYKENKNIKNAIKIKEDLNIKFVPYNNVISMINDVINKKTNFILIDKSSYEIILKMNGKDENKDLKVIYEFDIEKIIKPKNKVKKNFNIYIRGIDTDGLSDFNTIITVNTKTHEVLLTSIPRDYYMEIYGTNGKKDSLSHMFIYPDNTSQKSLEQFFNITLDYRVNITPEGVVDLVDKIGGITYCSEQNFDAYIPALNSTDKTKNGWFHINKGCQNLDGMETYGVAHERNSFVGRDRMRQKNCQKIIISIFEKMKSANLISNYKEILDSLNNLYTTDIPKEVITNIAKDTIDGAEWKFITQSVDGSDKWDADIAILNDKGYAMIPNRDDVVKATNKINEVLSKK